MKTHQSNQNRHKNYTVHIFSASKQYGISKENIIEMARLEWLFEK